MIRFLETHMMIHVAPEHQEHDEDQLQELGISSALSNLNMSDIAAGIN